MQYTPIGMLAARTKATPTPVPVGSQMVNEVKDVVGDA